MTQTMSIQANKSPIPSDHELAVFQTMAKQAVASKLYRGIGDEFAVLTIMLAARELDIPPMAALNGGINIINGKTEISARMMAALIMRRGHKIEIKRSDVLECHLVGTRYDNGLKANESFVLEEAKIAGLIKDGGGWKKWPKDMLYARCMSRLARRLFPDVIGMGYVEGEISESFKKPVVSDSVQILDMETQENFEEMDKRQEELLAEFLSSFDKLTSEEWKEYINELIKKMDLSISQIIDKYNSDPKSATEKMKSWIDSQKNKRK